MEVILLKDVDKVGLRGEVVNVARGYMRNYLEPQRLAEPATPARVAELAKREAERARHEARSFEQAQEIAETLRKTVLRFEVPAGPRGVLFGSVTPTDIADELWRTRKIRIDRRKIDVAEPIKRLGRYEVPLDVFQDVRVEVKALVLPQGGELPSDEELDAWAAEDAAEAAAQALEDEEPVEEEADEPVQEETDAGSLSESPVAESEPDPAETDEAAAGDDVDEPLDAGYPEGAEGDTPEGASPEGR